MGWLSGYRYRVPITLAAPAADLEDFPFPVQIPATHQAALGAACRADGYDVRFTGSDGTSLLSFERDVFSIVAGSAAALWWTRIPAWSSILGNTIYEYFGKADATDASSGPDTFDSNHVGVYHGGDGSTLSVADSSPAGNHGTNYGATAAAGVAGGAMSVVGGSPFPRIEIPDADSLSFAGGMTVSGWWRMANAGPFGGVHKYTAGGGYEWTTGRYSDNRIYSWVYRHSNNTYKGRSAPGAAYTGAWAHIAFRWDGGSAAICGNGEQIDDQNFSSGVFTGMENGTSPVQIGGNNAGVGSGTGLYDEIRISNIVRSPAWIAAEYGTIAAPASWQTWGAVQRRRRSAVQLVV